LHDSLGGSVKKLVYTSSTGVVWNVNDMKGVSEGQAVVPQQGYDSYHHTKAIAERLILEANRKELHTVVLRPCGMVGYAILFYTSSIWRSLMSSLIYRPGDQQLMHRLATVLERGQHKIQIGDNTNLVDWVYVGNVADAHILASDLLPTRTDEALTPHQVAGHVFFVTNDTPLPGWNFSRMIWRELGAPEKDLDSKNVIKISRTMALFMAAIAEIWCKVSGGSTEFTRFAVQYVTATQYYDISKVKLLVLLMHSLNVDHVRVGDLQARTVLGYKPKVSLEEAAKLAAQVRFSVCFFFGITNHFCKVVEGPGHE
jgi:sterol-4alpha-carboxylate 3-dehydrogenase (decarboxylating)